MSADEWLNDLQGDDGGGGSLFQDNFRRMVEGDEVDSLNVQTIRNQIGQITDRELLADAIEADDRDDAVEAYRERLGELNAENQSGDDGDEADESVVADEVAEEIVEAAEETDDETREEAAEEAPEPPDEEGDAQDAADGSESESDVDETDGSDDAENSADDQGDGSERTVPEVDVSSIAPDALSRDAAIDAAAESTHTMLVWGPEGTGKTHIGHSAPGPIAYIDTEGKANEIADKFDKEIHYFQPDDYQEAKAAMEQALELLAAYREHGVTGTIVVDSMTVMWEWAQVDYALFAYQTDDLSEVNFQGIVEKDWAEIKRRHNTDFRDVILDSPYHVVFTAGEREKYDADNDWETQMEPDGEKHNKYAVKDEIRLRVDEQGRTVADLQKAARTRYSFVGLPWPEWESIYDAIETIADGEKQGKDVVGYSTTLDAKIVEGQPTADGPDGGNGGDDE